MSFLGISLKSARLGTGRAILSHLNEKREDKIREQERQNRLDDMRTEFELRDDYAQKAETRTYEKEIQRLKDGNVIKNEQQAIDWKNGLTRATQLSEQTGNTYAYLGNGNYKILDKDDKEKSFAEKMAEAKEITNLYRTQGVLTGSQAYVPSKTGFTLTGKAETDSDGKMGIAGVMGKGFDVFKTESSVSEIDPVNSFNFPYGDGQIGLLVLADESRLQKEKVPYHNASHAMNTLLSTDLGYHIDRYKQARAGEQVEGGELFGFTKRLFMNNAPSILEGLKGAKTSEGLTSIPNPMIRFDLTEYAKQGPEQAEHAKFIATEIIAPALTLQKELALKALNLPADTPVHVDENFNMFIDSEVGAKLEPYSQEVTDADGNTKKQLLPEFKSLATEIAQYSGRSMTDVLSHAVSSSGDPMKHMQDVQAFSATMKRKAKSAGLNKISINQIEENALLDIIKESGDAATAISTIRSMIPSAPPREITEISYSPEGGKKPIWNRTVKDFSGIDIEGARQRAESAAKARRTIGMIRELQDKFGARMDLIEVLKIKLAGGVEAMGEISGMLNDFEGYVSNAEIAGADPDTIRRNQEARQETLREIREMQTAISRGGAGLEASALAMMLSRQLGYYMAGAVQGGGSTGRNISDFDVRNNMQSMQLDTFAPSNVKKVNLEYLYEEMDQTYAIYNSYASSKGDFATWQATQVYDDLVRGTHSNLTNLLARAGGIPEEEAQQRSLRLERSGGVRVSEGVGSNSSAFGIRR